MYVYRWCMWNRWSWYRQCRWWKGCRRCCVVEVTSWIWQQFFGESLSQELSGKKVHSRLGPPGSAVSVWNRYPQWSQSSGRAKLCNYPGPFRPSSEWPPFRDGVQPFWRRDLCIWPLLRVLADNHDHTLHEHLKWSKLGKCHVSADEDITTLDAMLSFLCVLSAKRRQVFALGFHALVAEHHVPLQKYSSGMGRRSKQASHCQLKQSSSYPWLDRTQYSVCKWLSFTFSIDPRKTQCWMTSTRHKTNRGKSPARKA